jgi:hypothetical protein
MVSMPEMPGSDRDQGRSSMSLVKSAYRTSESCGEGPRRRSRASLTSLAFAYRPQWRPRACIICAA